MSLRLRLALWYGALTWLVVLTVGLMTYATHSRGHFDDMDRLLRGTAQHVADEATNAVTLSDLTSVFSTPVEPDLVTRVYDVQGRVLAASSNTSSAPAIAPRDILGQPPAPPYDPLVGLAPDPVAVKPGPGTFGLISESGGRRWRLYVLPLEGGQRFVVAAMSLERVDAAIGRFRQLVPLFTIFGTAFSFLGARLLAGRALRPVAVLTATAAAIANSRGFSRRVPTGNRNDELGRLALTFNEMLASLEAAYRHQQRFVADASHELRAPLTAIQANLELLERVPNMPADERAEVTQEASREAQRLTRLVADLLALARADAGVAMRRERVELDRVLLEARRDARALARGQALAVGALEPAVVEGDQDRLKQLCLILLDNALKYTPPGGQVTLSLRNGGGWAELAVQDTGAGISPEDLPHLFERFYRADPARARDPGGSGLGLAIAKWIVDQHGGRITLASEPGKGTTATVALPVAKSLAGLTKLSTRPQPPLS
ncbi:MAG: sensor histidine kinase [Chloroflexota bacterium]